MPCTEACSRRASPNQRADASNDDLDADQPMDFDEERDFADQGPLTDRDMEEDVQNRATLMKHLPACMNAADIEQLLQDIPEQPPVVVPARTVQEAVDAGDLPPLDVDPANVFTQSERILLDHIRKHCNNSAEVKDLPVIHRVLHHPDFNTARSQGEQVEGCRDEEASQRGRCSGGC